MVDVAAGDVEAVGAVRVEPADHVQRCGVEGEVVAVVGGVHAIVSWPAPAGADGPDAGGDRGGVGEGPAAAAA
jgi:hypothetical protein